ncbi:MAG: hypothetical protein ABSF78_14080 [Candidatus Acidiferrales bacterium]|jgi:hypothetical protein
MDGQDPDDSSSSQSGQSSADDPSQNSCSADDPEKNSCSPGDPAPATTPNEPPAEMGPPAPPPASNAPAHPLPSQDPADYGPPPTPDNGPAATPPADGDPAQNQCSADEPEMDACGTTNASGPPAVPAPAPAPPSPDVYANSDSQAGKSCSEDPVAAPVSTCGAPKTYLAVKVTDNQNLPLLNADVSAPGLGTRTTDKYGLADYGEITPGTYSITVTKDGYRPDVDATAGPALVTATAPAGTSTVVPVQLAVYRENIIFCGSEMDYNSFWLKMMFAGASWAGVPTLRAADQTTLAYVDVGYTNFEKLAFELLKDQKGIVLQKVASGSDIVDLINTRIKTKAGGFLGKFLLQDVLFFSHGQPDAIKLNYDSSPDVNFGASEIGSSDAEAFSIDGRFVSYACRTGVSSWAESFSSDAEAGPDASLAQQIANRFQVQTQAFMTRSFYGDVLREKADSDRIASTLKTARETQDGKVIEIPPDHQALPHPGLADKRGPKKEGTNEYALWRKAGGKELPRSGDTPTGLTPGLHVFNPK